MRHLHTNSVSAILLFMFLPLAILAGCSSSDSEIVGQKSAKKTAPDFALKNLDGELMRLSDHQDERPVLMVFWATWCGYCRQEIPKIVRMRNTYDVSELAILSIDIQEPRSLVATHAKQLGINYEVLLDHDGGVASQFNVQGVPTIYLIDRHGQLIAKDYRISTRLQELIKDNV